MLSELSLKDFFGSNGLPCTQYFVWYWEGYLRNPESCEWRFCLDRVTICAWFRQFTTHKHASYERLGESEVDSLTLAKSKHRIVYFARGLDRKFPIRLNSVIDDIISPNSKAMATSSSVIILVFTMVILSCGRAQEILKIWRDSNVSTDDITVPDSQCNRTQQQCDRYNAKHLTQCLCYCEERGGQATAFWEPSSTCIPVKSLRQQSGTNFFGFVFVFS